MRRLSTVGLSTWHLLEDYQLDISWKTSSKKSIGRPSAEQSAEHLMEGNLHDIYCRIISRISTDWSSDFMKICRTGYILIDHQKDIYWLTIRRTSTGRQWECNFLEYSQHDIYQRIITWSGHLLEDHQNDIYCRTISRTSTWELLAPAGNLL